jgi:muramoyltetrapeptide carboxypeptidase LdcA involved in peptidoglycan recycling
VTIAATPDSLSALNLLFHFRRLGDDLTFFPSGSGCASIFRLPFGELAKDNPRAVIGNADVSSRPFFDANTLFFTVAGEIFETMLQDTDKSFLAASAWKKLKERV